MLDREIINALLEIKAVELRVDKENWFTWASGIKSQVQLQAFQSVILYAAAKFIEGVQIRRVNRRITDS